MTMILSDNVLSDNALRLIREHARQDVMAYRLYRQHLTGPELNWVKARVKEADKTVSAINVQRIIACLDKSDREYLGRMVNHDTP